MVPSPLEPLKFYCINNLVNTMSVIDNSIKYIAHIEAMKTFHDIFCNYMYGVYCVMNLASQLLVSLAITDLFCNIFMTFLDVKQCNVSF